MASDSEIQSEFTGDQKTQKNVRQEKTVNRKERSNRLSSLNKCINFATSLPSTQSSK